MEGNNHAQSSANPDNPVAAAIYDQLVTSISIEAACKLQPDEISYSDPIVAQERRSLYPGLYESEEDVQRAMEEYAVEVPAQRPRRMTLAEDPENDEGDKESPSTPTVMTRQQTFAQSDVWGRNPPKEPKEMVECSICNRQVNTLRFAPHLDKCMGIGTTVRAAASGGATAATTRSTAK
jgi:Sgf11 (transcriptional regulation protein)